MSKGEEAKENLRWRQKDTGVLDIALRSGSLESESGGSENIARWWP